MSYSDSLQSQVNASQGGNISVPLSQPYYFDKPVFVDNDYVAVTGAYGKPRFVAAPYYCGPFLVFGMRQAVSDWSVYRPWGRPTGMAVFDDSVSYGVRGIDTRGNANVLIQCHPLQYGGMSPKFGGNCPNYWSEIQAVTFDFLLARPPGVTWESDQNLFGMRDGVGRCQPWVFQTGGSPDMLRFAYVTYDLRRPGVRDLGLRRFEWQLPGSGPWRVTLMVNMDAGEARVWLGDDLVPVGVANSLPPGAPSSGLRFAPHDGSTPLLIGGANIFPGGAGQRFQLFGLRITDGLVYEGAPKLAFRKDSAYASWAVNDHNRYFNTISHPPSGLREIGYLPLDDPPGRTLALRGWGNGVGFWVVLGADRPTFGNAVRDIRFEGPGQAPVTIGNVLRFEAARVETVGSLQGIGSLSVGANYPIVLDSCLLRGSDAAYFGVWQGVRAWNTDIMQCGREGFRLQGGGLSLSDCMVAFVGNNTETVFDILGDEYGGPIRLTDVMVDTEGGSVATAFVRHQAGNSPEQRLVVDGFTAGTCPGAALIQMVGSPGVPKQNAAEVDVKRLKSYSAPRAVYEVLGGGWQGSVNGIPVPYEATQ